MLVGGGPPKTSNSPREGEEVHYKRVVERIGEKRTLLKCTEARKNERSLEVELFFGGGGVTPPPESLGAFKSRIEVVARSGLVLGLRSGSGCVREKLWN